MSFVYGSPAMSPRAVAAAAEADASVMRASHSPRAGQPYAAPVVDLIGRNNMNASEFAARCAMPPSMSLVGLAGATTAPDLVAGNVGLETEKAAAMARDTIAVRQAALANAAAANAAASHGAAAARAGAAHAVAARNAAFAADAVAKDHWVAHVVAPDVARSHAHIAAASELTRGSSASRAATLSHAFATDHALTSSLHTRNVGNHTLATDAMIRASLSPRHNYLNSPVVGSPGVGSPFHGAGSPFHGAGSPVLAYGSPTFRSRVALRPSPMRPLP
ncbi:hypothetical protein DIPPA_32234 [Diplonema papillatum]|nr:hypothetical protein DIPPA_32234 [Diplonema papillatum]|eukprot:gene2893-4540_t